jgi:hypothetical protein
MHKFHLIGLLFLLFWGCQEGVESERQVDPAIDAARLKTALHERKSQEGLVPYSDSVLQSMLPPRLQGFAFVDTKSGSFQQEFAEVERVYFQEDGNYLLVHLADYEASPTAFEQIWNTYETVLQTENGRIVDPHIQHFCWQRTDTLTKVFHRECGLAYRFHLQFRSNHPRADSLFDELQTAISIPTPTP